MRFAYLLSVWLHILAATLWLGGMAFLVLILVPWLRRQSDRAASSAILRDIATRFRTIGWISFAVLLVTGSVNLWFRGVRISSFADATFLTSDFGRTLLFKLGLYIAVLALSAHHDFVIGPQASEQIARAPSSPEAERARRLASVIGRINGLLALALLGAAVVLVRGCP